VCVLLVDAGANPFTGQYCSHALSLLLILSPV
jgi:hypothetical protein